MAGHDPERDPNFTDERRRGGSKFEPEEFQPDPLLRPRVGPLMGGAILAVGALLAGLTIYLISWPSPPLQSEGGAALNTERTITGGGAPAPGDRATGTTGGPGVRTAPPPVKPAEPATGGPSAPQNPETPR